VINPNGDFIVTSVTAVNHISIAVMFSQPPDPVAAVDLANYTVDGLTLSGTPTLSGSIVTIATAEQADTTYNATVANITRASDTAPLWMGTASFKGRPEFKVTGATSATNGLAQVMFSGPPDMATATQLSNYSIPNLTLSGAPIVVGNTVTLITSPQSATSYTVTVANVVRAGDSEALTNAVASFTGRLGFNVVSAAAPNSATVVVTFDAPPNATQAATLANYSIPGLTLSGVPVVSGNTATITTSPQAIQTYTVTVTGVTRESDAEPLIVNARNFSGVDTFNVASAAANTSNTVQVTFDAPPNTAQAQTLGNYSIPTLTPTAVAYPGTGNVVTLTVPAMSATTYTVTVNNVTRASDAEVLSTKTATFTGRPKFNVVSATALSSTQIRITFDGPPSATNGVVLANYVIPGLTPSGTPMISGNTVTINTSAQSNQSYTVTVNNVTRSGDNEPLLGKTATFSGRVPFNVLSAAAVTTSSVSVTFDAPPNSTAAALASNYTIPGLTVSNASYPGTGNVVTLTTTPSQMAISYTVTVNNNVTRASDGEVLTTKAATFTGRVPFTVTSAVATSSTTVQVTFSANANPTQANTLTNYNISPGLAITAVTASGNTATLTTAAQTNTSYTVSVVNVTRASDAEPLQTNTATFTGRLPFNVSSAAPTSNTSITVTFSAPPGTGAATLGNYVGNNGLTFSAVNYPGTGNVVTLTTSSQTGGQSYTVTVNNVLRAGDNEALTTKTANFTGRSSFNVTAAAPTLNTRISVTFDSAPNSGQANTMGNYVIPGLTVTSVNYPGTGNTVTVNTTSQTGGQAYTVTVNNVTRGSDGEALTAKTANFSGRPKFDVSGAASIGNTTITVTFSATPNAAATTIGNYMITAGSLSLTGTPVLNGNTVTITTSTQTAGASYTVTVANVLRASDSEPLTVTSASFMGKSGFNVASASSVDTNTVSVTFDAAPNLTEAQTQLNYTFNNGLMATGAPVLLGNTVTIPTTAQAGGTYTVTVANVHRASDNVALSVNSANFVHTPFNVVSAASLNAHSATVTFDAPPNQAQAEAMGNYAFSDGVVPTGAPVLSGSTVTIPTSDQVATTMTVTVAGVTRANDGTVLSTNMATFMGRSPFSVASAASGSSSTMSITFTDPPVSGPATTLANYNVVPALTLSNPVLAGNTVSFTTTAQSNTTYTITASNITRASDGEALSVTSAMFSGTPLATPVVNTVAVTSTTPNNGTTFYNTGTANITITGQDFLTTTAVRLDDTDGAGNAVNTNATTFTIVNGTTITATFPAGIRSNYTGWNVKVTNSIGTNTSSAQTLVVKAGLLISEVYQGNSGGSGPLHEFIELYNPTNGPLNLSTLQGGMRLHIRTSGGGDTNMALTLTRTTIASHGFFLIVSSASNNSDTWGQAAIRDAEYNEGVAELASNGGCYISFSATAQAKVIDKVGWGVPPANSFEGTVLTNLSLDNSYQRKPNSTTPNIDTDVNSADFNAQSISITPKNSLGQP
jgi:hypothetical protein